MLFFDLIKQSFGDTKYKIYPDNIENIPLAGITSDSRDVRDGYVFAALPGYKADGVSFIQEAVSSGASVIITEADDEMCLNVSNIAYVIQVHDAREAFALAVKEFYGRINESFDLIGVTGTNGKTSTTHYIAHILNTLGAKSAVIGTVGGNSPDVKIPLQRTTPDPQSLFEMFSVFAKYGTKAIAMEVSSHALELKRTYGLKFAVSVFTNLTQDHLDFHKNMNSYMRAKLKLFGQSKLGIINIDDPYGKKIKELAECKTVTYSLLSETADHFAKDIKHSPEGSTFTYVAKDKKEYGVRIKTPGTFSVYNALAAISATVEYGFEPEKVCRALSSAEGVPGRFENVKNRLGINVIVDYAHTPDGIKNVLLTAKEFTKGRLISVFGCGGERDRDKRAKMGAVSRELADYTVITSDNPRSENEIMIASDIISGMDEENPAVNIIIDRKAAIRHAIECAEKCDTVLIMGKGHERYQQFNDIKLVSDDKEIIAEILEQSVKG